MALVGSIMSGGSKTLARFADWVARSGPFPATARREAYLCLLDTLACMLAGAQTDSAGRARAAARLWGSDPQCHAIGTGERLPAAGAAFVNGVAAHAQDFDDCELLGSTHPSAVLVPPILALAALRQRDLAQLLEAYIVGYEAIALLGRVFGYAHYEAGWHATATLGTLGAAAAAARVLELDAGQSVQALSLAASMAAGMKCQFGTAAKPLQAGLTAKRGVEAALLAESGLDASPDAWDAFAGLYNAATAFTGAEAVGEPLALVDATLARKAYPCCHYTHRPIVAALALGCDLECGAIEKATLRMPAPYAAVAGKRAPHTTDETRFSATYCVASALVEGGIGPESFAAAAIARPETVALEALITLAPYAAPGIADLDPGAPDSLCLTLAGGATREITLAETPGTPDAPLDLTTLQTKARSCAAPVLGEDGGAAFAALFDGEPPGGLQTILAALAPSPRTDLRW